MKTKDINFWPIGVTLFLILFAITVITVGVLLSRESYELVRSDYYNHEIAYEDHLNALRRTKTLQEQPRISTDLTAHEIILQFPKSLSENSEALKLHLYYPADQQQDLHFDITLDDQATQRISLKGSARGNWKAALKWVHAGETYILEKRIQL